MGWSDLIGQWALLEFSFHAALGIDLEEVWTRKTWRWFSIRVKHLLSTDTPLAHHFAPDDTTKTEAPSE